MKKKKKILKKDIEDENPEFYIFEDDDLLPFLDTDPNEELRETIWTVLGSGTVRQIDINKTKLLNAGKIDG